MQHSISKLGVGQARKIIISKTLTENFIDCIKSKSKSMNYGAKLKWKISFQEKFEFLKLGSIWCKFYASSNKDTFFDSPGSLKNNQLLYKICQNSSDLFFNHMLHSEKLTGAQNIQHFTSETRVYHRRLTSRGDF